MWSRRRIFCENWEKKNFVDGYVSKTRTIFQYYGCKWHGCPCRKERNSLDEERYSKTIDLEKKDERTGLKACFGLGV